MSAQWYRSSNDGFERASGALAQAWNVAAQPGNASRIRLTIVVALAVWAIFALAKLIWLLLPDTTGNLPPDAVILNPIESRASAETVKTVDINAMRDWHLFGVPGVPSDMVLATPVAKSNSDRDGIEDGARESRLELKLRGVVSASEDGLGHAMIEHRSRQQVYAVGDELPVGKSVTLAKVMPQGVVLDNRGTYELLNLFEDTALLDQVSRQRIAVPAPPPKKVRQSGAVQIPADGASSAVAQSLRRQLYDNPQSLAQVVRVSAVRENNALRGYRVDPGKSSSQFSALGFRPGDVVTSVNGINLDNPANTMQLYQLMRSASEAVFDLERGSETLTLTVNLNGG